MTELSDKPVATPLEVGAPGRWDADAGGWFGEYGGRWIPEALVAALEELTDAWTDAMADPSFTDELARIGREYAGLPSALYEARALSEKAGVRVLLKREDLLHTGAHKIRNVLGQALLTKRMGKKRVIAETGAGQHGVASATAAAFFGLDCTVYMGAVDTRRQALNVARMRLLGAEVVPVESGSATLKDAINEAMRDWVASVDHTAYLFGTAAGPHPFPSLVRDFTRSIGDEARAQCLERYGRLPDAVAACVGGGSNAIGLYTAFLDDPDVAVWGFEAGGDGVDTPRHAATIVGGGAGVLHGSRTMILADSDGQTIESHSVSAGLDYPGVGPQHAHLAATGRATYHAITDTEAMDALALLARTEGIIPAIETAHAIAGALKMAPQLRAEHGPDAILLVNLSGRGDKDMETATAWFGLDPGSATAEPVGDPHEDPRA
ncbi:tryptophan synthase subunit beta [Nocardioides lentus]|uniref:Tryptophan synthase beta chain n=1 Tax=Nocardioides lentus TaxID=338077 RepID=A0ABN2P3P9_9ACTN